MRCEPVCRQRQAGRKGAEGLLRGEGLAYAPGTTACVETTRRGKEGKKPVETNSLLFNGALSWSGRSRRGGETPALVVPCHPDPAGISAPRACPAGSRSGDPPGLLRAHKVTRKASDWLMVVADLHISASPCHLRQYSNENQVRSVHMGLRDDVK